MLQEDLFLYNWSLNGRGRRSRGEHRVGHGGEVAAVVTEVDVGNDLRREWLVGPDPAADAGVVLGQVLPQVHRARVGPVAHQAREPLLARVPPQVLLKKILGKISEVFAKIDTPLQDIQGYYSSGP